MSNVPNDIPNTWGLGIDPQPLPVQPAPEPFGQLPYQQESPLLVVKQRDLWAEIDQQRFHDETCLLYTSPSPRDRQKSRMPSSA